MSKLGQFLRDNSTSILGVATVLGGVFFAGGFYEHMKAKVDILAERTKREVDILAERTKREVDILAVQTKLEVEVGKRENIERLFRIMNEAEYVENRPTQKKT